MQIDTQEMGGIKHYEKATKEDLLELVKQFGNADNMQDQQNDAPTMQEFLTLAEKYPNMTFHGYVVSKTREDYRVSVEGFEVDRLTADQALELTSSYGSADECQHEKDIDGTYSVYAWWD